MTLSQVNETAPDASKSLRKEWKWEKRHYLLLIAGACLLLWFFSGQLKNANWVKSSLNYLPMLGGLVLVSEQLLRLV